MVSEQEIKVWARGFGGRVWADEACLLERYGLAGDDADEFMQAFAEEFGVDLSEFRWYFHYNGNEPPFVETVWPYSPQGEKLARVPMTAEILAGAANMGYWDYAYPEHKTGDPGGHRALWGFLAMALVAVLIGVGVSFFR